MLGVQARASERLQGQIIEEIKELVHTKTEEALQLAGKEHDLWMYQNEKEEAKYCRAPGNRGRMRKWLGHHQEIRRNGQAGKRRQRRAEVPEIILVSDTVEGKMLNEGEEIRSPKRKVIRVESEETQDYVTEEKSTEYEEEEERTFVPTVGVLLKPLFRFDNQRSSAIGSRRRWR